MAEIRPFRALRYDTSRVPLEGVVTQPYDKISPEMRKRYLSSHPYNLIRVLRPLDAGPASPGVSPYERASGVLESWRREGVLTQTPGEVLFAYYQTFTIPGTDQVRTRKGFIGLTRLADYTEGTVFPHERTLSGPREDRLELLRHTRTHFGQVFLLYSDPRCRVDGLLDRAIDGVEPTSVTDEYAVEHRLWMIADPEAIEAVCRAMAGSRLLIADGHHRYETALAFRNEERRRLRGDSQSAEWLMTTLVNMDSPGMVVLPTHRVLSGLDRFDSDRLVEALRVFSEVRDVDRAADLTAELAWFRGRPALGLVTGSRQLLLLPRSGSGEGRSSRQAPGLADLDVVLLHDRVLEGCFGLTEEDVRSERFIHYVRDPREGIAEVEAGRAQACFLLNPTPVERVREIAFAGSVLPQKSTDFFPKLLSGLAMYAL